MVLLDELLLHFFIILVPLLIYQIYWANEKLDAMYLKESSILFMTLLLSSLTCMLFPIFKLNGFSYDYRSLLIMYAFLYGGRKIGFWMIVLTTLYRFYLDGQGVIFSLFMLPFFYVIPFILSSNWRKFSKKKKYLLSTIISSFAMALFVITLLIWGTAMEIGAPMPVHPIVSLLSCAVGYIVTFFLMIYFTEFLRENKRMKLAIQDSEKMTVVSELAASIAHEVRNPLTVVKGFIQLIEKDENSSNRQYMKLVLSELDRAESLISDYLNLAKKTEIQKMPIDISDLLRSIQSVMESYSNINGVRIQSSIEQKLYVLGDMGKLKQAFYNIMKNGIEAVQADQGMLAFKVYRGSSSVNVEITDNGIGMNEEELRKIGEPFYTNKESGTGLGVMVTKAIIHEHGGTMAYESTVGKGTTVKVSLPIIYMK
ncbi:ATP-binding protein [Peribacillus alkalitolerans]|uniref:ATP-binding protein n=1 Tax=Peribacillus alkalitolerans TaxID=1550385 RepID=UPI0013D0DCC3|nr:ATP-binding protein [Peribacillus alkalitolerans]